MNDIIGRPQNERKPIKECNHSCLPAPRLGGANQWPTHGDTFAILPNVNSMRNLGVVTAHQDGHPQKLADFQT